MAERARVELEVSADGFLSSGDDCRRRLEALLRTRAGVSKAHVEETDSTVCVHFDPRQVSLGEVRLLAARLTTQLASRYGHLHVTGRPRRAAQARRQSARIRGVPGVLDARVGMDGSVRVEFDREQTSERSVVEALDRSGIVAMGPEAVRRAQTLWRTHGELSVALLCGAALLTSWVLGVAGAGATATTLAAVLAFALGTVSTAGEAIASLRERRLEIDLLMLLAALGAASLGAWAEGALLLFLFNLGHALEEYALGRAKRAIAALGELAPDHATVLRDGEQIDLPVHQVAVGDVLLIRPNSRVPADGFVLKGESSVDESSISGESIPVDKTPVGDASRAATSAAAGTLAPESALFAGTLNGSDALEMQVTRRAEESTLARVVELVTEAETLQSPTQRFTERFESLFVPAVLCFVALLLLSSSLSAEPFRETFYRAMAVLVAASPCALAIATPSAVLSAVACAARAGVLVKGGGPLETLGRLSSVAFDKTGTLTEGRPRVTDVLIASGVSDSELRTTTVAVEQGSDHPLSRAITEDLAHSGSLAVEIRDLRSIAGRGVQAVVDGDLVLIGKRALFDDAPGPPPEGKFLADVRALEENGRTTVVVRRGDRFLGAIGLMDTPRRSAPAVVGRLRELGIEHQIMISGDNQRVADAVAASVGVDEAHGDLMPEDKVSFVADLSRAGPVAMVGDGVNDAPAMANAAVGVAMGAAGSDVALETADIALMGDDLAKLPFAVGLSRRAARVIRQNLWISLGMVAVLVPATLFGLGIGSAVVLHEGSTLLVVANALRLLVYRDPAPMTSRTTRSRTLGEAA